MRPTAINSTIPRELEMVCLRCLEKAPEDRYPSATAVAEELERYLKGEEIETKHPGVWPRVRRWVRREPALAYRLAALVLSFAVIQVRFHISAAVHPDVHWQVLGVLGLWGLASIACQRLLARGAAWSRAVRYCWSAVDVVSLTALLLLDGVPVSPVIIGFPVLIAASGLWFQVRLVWVTTALTAVAYAALVLAFYLRDRSVEGLHKHIIFVVGLAVLGLVVAYQVQRVRALSRYYEHRPLP
jgi:serine/threonine-protein kinase